MKSENWQTVRLGDVLAEGKTTLYLRGGVFFPSDFPSFPARFKTENEE